MPEFAVLGRKQLQISRNFWGPMGPPLADYKRQSEFTFAQQWTNFSSVRCRFIAPASDFICKAVNLFSNTCLSIDGQSQFVPVIKFGMDWTCECKVTSFGNLPSV